MILLFKRNEECSNEISSTLTEGKHFVEMRPILLHGHSRPLTQLKFNREGDLLFTAAKDKSPNVWYSHNGERLGTYDGHNGAVTALDVDDQSRFLITGAADNTVKLWSVCDGTIVLC